MAHAHQEHHKLTGYTPEDILKAPAEPPHPDITENEQETSDEGVQFFLGLGVILAVSGFIVLLVYSIGFGLLMLVLGGVLIASGVLLPV